MRLLEECRIAVIGLGYVGLPLAIAFAKKYEVVGFDTSKQKIERLKSGFDENAQFKPEEIFESDASRIFMQAENRLHAQQALLALLL